MSYRDVYETEKELAKERYALVLELSLIHI